MNATADEKLLIIHQGAIGDLILSLPAFRAIKKAFPRRHMEVMGHASTLRLIQNRFYADGISSVTRASASSLYRDDGCIDRDMAGYIRRFDPVFVFGGPSQNSLLQNIKTISSAVIYRVKPFPEDAKTHVVDHQLGILCSHGFAPAGPAVPVLFPGPEDRQEAELFFKQTACASSVSPCFAVHPGSGGKRKNWPLDHCTALIEKLYRAFDARFFIIEGPADGNIIEQARPQLQSMPVSFLAGLELPLLAAILARCALYIGNDSGITHMAAAAGAPTVAVFGPTDPAVWGPRGEKVAIVQCGAGKDGWRWPDAVEVEKAAAGMIG